jgi:RNA polymerase sigma-70 factor (ECF subfamily)
MIELSDQVLIQRGQQGDREAVAQLYRRYAQAIARYVTYRVADDAVVEDIAAEVFLRMVEGLPRYQFTGVPFDAWLYRIAAARVADYYRKSMRHPEEDLPEDIADFLTPLELDFQEREELDTLRAAISQLSEEYQELLTLRFVERKSLAEVAEILKKNLHAVGSEQHRALKKLAELLGTEKSRYYVRGHTR